MASELYEVIAAIKEYPGRPRELSFDSDGRW